MRSRILISAVLWVAFGLSAQAGELTGRVMESETNNLIKDANIRILEISRVVASDKKGEFTFKNLPDSTYHLIVTHVAYERSDTILVAVHGSQSLDIHLTAAPWVLNDVVVTGTRSPHLLKDVPVQTEVVSQTDFQRVGARSVDQALNSSIGIQINKDFVSQSAAIRGIQGDQVLILVDGERQVGRVNGNIDLGQYSLSNVDKIEIVKGTGSTLYGSDAMGGVINIITKKPEPETKTADLYMDYGSQRSINPTLQLNFANEQTGLTLGGKFFRTDGYDLDPSTLSTQGSDKINRGNLDAKLTHQFSPRWKVTMDGRYMDEQLNWFEDQQVGPLLFNYADIERNHRYEGAATLDYLSGDKYSMKLRVFTTFYNHNFQKWDTSHTNWIDTSITTDRYYEVAYSSNYVIGHNHVITYGGDYEYAGLKSKELFQDDKSDQSGDAYLSYEYTPVKGVTVLPGVRYENHQAFGQKINPSFNLMVQPSEGLKFRGSIAQGFRAPSLKEEYFIFDHSSAGYIVYGGYVPIPDSMRNGLTFKPLEPENSINSSVSAEISYGSIGMHRITYFYNHLENLIQFMLVGFPSGTAYTNGVYVYQNVQRAITEGVEWESRVKMATWMDFSFSYDYLYTRDLSDVPHQKLRNCPDHTVKLFVNTHSDRKGIGATVWGTYESNKVFVPVTNTGGNEGGPTIYAPHHTTLNLSLMKKLWGGEFQVRMENLLNERNAEYYYGPGFSVYAGYKFDLNLHRVNKR